MLPQQASKHRGVPRRLRLARASKASTVPRHESGVSPRGRSAASPVAAAHVDILGGEICTARRSFPSAGGSGKPDRDQRLGHPLGRWRRTISGHPSALPTRQPAEQTAQVRLRRRAPRPRLGAPRAADRAVARGSGMGGRRFLLRRVWRSRRP